MATVTIKVNIDPGADRQSIMARIREITCVGNVWRPFFERSVDIKVEVKVEDDAGIREIHRKLLDVEGVANVTSELFSDGN